MQLKIVLAGLVGGIAMFFWGFVAHMVLPLGDAGIKPLPYQAAVLPAISAHLTEPGLYLFPWPESAPGTPMPLSTEARKKAVPLYQTSPHGLLIFYPPPGTMLASSQLGTEFATNCVSSLIAAALVCMTLGSLSSFARRLMFVIVIGLSATIAVNVPYWNWYGFPTTFTLAEMVEHVVGFALAGLVIAAIVKPARAPVAKNA